MGTAPVFGSAGEALEVARAALAFVASADAAELTCEEQAEALRALERANAAVTAARTSVLRAFTAGKGYSADADYSPRAWLMHQTGITRGAAVSYTAWVKRAARHRHLYAAMAAEQVSESCARTLATWTDKLPADQRDEADKFLAGEAKAGLGLRDLAGLAAEILARCRPDEPDPDTGMDFEDRSVTVQTTFGGAGVMHGDLTPECASMVGAVLDALAVPAGAGDDRTKEQRYHDALQEAMRRLVAGGLLPQRAGQPVKALVHISLADLIRLEGSPALLQEWASSMRARWAARRAAASQTAAGCEVHHLTHKADGGKTSVCDCALFCFFHHQVVIHRWGWTVILNPDGTTTAWNKDKTKTLHSHSPPAPTG